MSKHISIGDVLFATVDDIPEWMKLVDIVKENFPGLVKESYLTTLRKNIARKTALCYKYNSIIAGILIFSTKQNCLSCIAVHPDCRRMGIASKLIDKMLVLLPPDEDITVTTFRECDTKGIAPRRLYKKFGFEEAELLTEFNYPVQKFVLHRSESFQQLTSKWCNLSSNAEVVIITDTDRLSLAIEMQNQIINNCRIINIDDETEYFSELLSLNPSDLVVALFSFNTFVFKGANKVFSSFGKPRGLKAKYVFIRLGISKESLLQGISTPIELVYETIDRLHSYKSATKLRVINTAGTNITLSINAFTTCEHRIVEDGGMAFLPPSETSSEVIAKTANGKIVVDVTIGQLYHYGNLIGYFGLVASPVTLIVDNGMITDIIGEDMATELKEKLFALPEDCRTLVELGHGLSKMTPTGLIGVDESIIDTCHFGIGDGASCGVHLDVVISNPTIEEV